MNEQLYNIISKSIEQKLQSDNFVFKDVLNQIEFGKVKEFKDMKNFIISCTELGKELLDKENLSSKEEQFLENLDVITDKYFN